MEMPSTLDNWIKLFSLAGAVVAFSWGIVQFLANQNTLGETRRIEATKPFLERQLKLYTEVTVAAATLSISDDPNEIEHSRKRFWSLYWGELALVEDKEVEAAMVKFGEAIEAGTSGIKLQQYSLQLAHACRDSLARSWGVEQWRKPHSE